MSEYQYHEWQTVDRTLTPEEQDEVEGLSSHIDVSASRAVVTYNWGSFKYKPKEVLLDYFDAYFYSSEWGRLRLMFRFPTGLLQDADIEPYLVQDFVTFETYGEWDVLDLDFNPEDSEWREPSRADLSDFVRLRADLLAGDFRLLYLAWLGGMGYYGYAGLDWYAEDDPDRPEDDPDRPEDDWEPPVPPGLKTLSGGLDSFVRTFDIDPYQVMAAAEASPDLKPAAAIDYAALVERLTREECDEFLTRLAESDAGVGPALRKRLAEFLPQPERAPAVARRSFREIYQRARELEEAEKARQAEAERQKHAAAMRALASREGQAWQEVENLLTLGAKTGSVYDQATAKLEGLKELAEFQNKPEVFSARLRGLAEKFRARSSLMERWRKRGWI